MLTRRDCLRRLSALAAGAVALPLIHGCGGAEREDASPGTGATVASVAVPRAAPDAAAASAAVRALDAFGADLYGRLAAGEGNRLASPYSALVALAMTRAGAGGATAAEMDAVLHAPSPTPAALDAGLNALAQALAARAGTKTRGDGSTAELSLAVGNALWAQRGLAFAEPFLTALGRDYGAGVQLVDYAADAEAARAAINAWVAAQTAERIAELVPEGTITTDTRLVLTNAIALLAPWEIPFAEAATADAPFTLLDGSRVDVPLMRGGGQLPYAEGDGHVRATLPYAGRELAMTLIVPDAGRFAEVEATLTGEVLAGWLAAAPPLAVALAMPRFSFRARASLADALAGLGMPTAFSDAADFRAMTADVELQIGDVVHEAFIAVDEAGTEAAAATAVVAMAGAAPAEPVPLVVDRPFLFAIHDVATAAPLFLGRVVDPRAA